MAPRQPGYSQDNLLTRIDKLIKDTDFSVLYSNKNNLFSIGYNLDENKLIDSYYDLLASEARQASLVAIAKRDVPSKHWNSLSRTLTTIDKYKGLVSWSGTAFEYLMPNINIKKYKGTFLDESTKFVIMCQKKYAKTLGIPWGISEAAFAMQDLNYNYQYKAFGIPWLGLKRGLADDTVVSSYGTIMAITEDPKGVLDNLKELEKQEMAKGKYGFYESIDYTLSRLKPGEKYSVVKTYMAHHQGLILLSINNFLNNNILQKRFEENPEIKTIDILLQERMPEDVIITKETKEKVEKLKYTDYESYTQRKFTKLNPNITNINVISNDNYTVVLNDKGIGYSKYKNILINRFKETEDSSSQGIFFYVKNIKSKRIWSNASMSHLANADRYEVQFSNDSNKFMRQDGSIETTTKTIVCPEDNVEIRRVEFVNSGNLEEVLEVTSFIEPILSTKEADISHPAFNNLFLRYEYLEDLNTILVKRRNRHENKKEIYMAVLLDTVDETIGELEYEIDKEKFLGRNNFNIPKMVLESKPLSRNIVLVTEPIVALKRSIKLNPSGKASLNLVICVAENRDEIISLVEKYKNTENVLRAFELSKARAEVEARFIGLKGIEIESYQKMLGYLLFNNPMKCRGRRPRRPK